VASAKLAVKSAETALTRTKLRAPMAGTVASVAGHVGDAVTAGSSSTSSSSSSSTGGSATGAGGATGGSGSSSTSTGFVTLVQVSRYTMQVSLSESDVGKVKVGQRATVTVNAADGEAFSAHVTSVGVLSSSSTSSTSGAAGSTGSAVSYPVTLTLDQTASKLKAGMSASADVITAQASGLSVPTAAIRGSTVTVERNGKRSTQTVQTGVAGSSATIVTSGLQAGDQVVVTSPSATAGAAAGAAGGGAAGAAGAAGGIGGAGGGFGAGGAAGGGRFGGGAGGAGGGGGFPGARPGGG
jgi:multidrug efflux pump subunit AcrA (membrane-fusion protein)